MAFQSPPGPLPPTTTNQQSIFFDYSVLWIWSTLIFGSNSLNLNVRNAGSVKEQQHYLQLHHATQSRNLSYRRVFGPTDLMENYHVLCEHHFGLCLIHHPQLESRKLLLPGFKLRTIHSEGESADALTHSTMVPTAFKWLIYSIKSESFKVRETISELRLIRYWHGKKIKFCVLSFI